jgi:hypothetical protein
MNDDKIAEIKAQHAIDERWRNGPSMLSPQSHDHRGYLLAEVERLRARVEMLERSSRELLETLSAAVRSGNFTLSGSEDMSLFVNAALNKLKEATI